MRAAVSWTAGVLAGAFLTFKLRVRIEGRRRRGRRRSKSIEPRHVAVAAFAEKFLQPRAGRPRRFGRRNADGVEPKRAGAFEQVLL